MFFSKPFVISWVGADYLESSEIMQVLVLCFIFNSLTNPCASIIFAFNKAKDVLKVSVVQPLIFWIGVFVTIDSWGVKSFAYFKFIACFVTALYYIYIATRILRISPYKYFIDNFIKPCIVAVIISAFFSNSPIHISLLTINLFQMY